MGDDARGDGQALPATEALASGPPGADAPRILDLATGPGEPAVTIARALPGAAVTASDVSEDMIAKAEARIEAAGVARNCEAARMSFEDLGRVPSDSVDVATCCYGYMFAGDAPTAFAETFRVLKPGGALVMTHWKDVAFMRLVGAVTAAARGPGAAPPPPPAINPLALPRRRARPRSCSRTRASSSTATGARARSRRTRSSSARTRSSRSSSRRCRRRRRSTRSRRSAAPTS